MALHPEGTLNSEYEDGGNELQNLDYIFMSRNEQSRKYLIGHSHKHEITEMRDPGLFISVVADYE